MLSFCEFSPTFWDSWHSASISTEAGRRLSDSIFTLSLLVNTGLSLTTNAVSQVPICLTLHLECRTTFEPISRGLHLFNKGFPWYKLDPNDQQPVINSFNLLSNHLYNFKIKSKLLAIFYSFLILSSSSCLLLVLRSHFH